MRVQKSCAAAKAVLFFQHKTGEVELPNLVVDLSDSLERMPFRNDATLTSLSTNSKIFFGGRVLSNYDLFNIMGWPRDKVQVPAGMSRWNVVRLLGNMLSTPVIGGILFCVLVEFDWTDQPRISRKTETEDKDKDA